MNTNEFGQHMFYTVSASIFTTAGATPNVVITGVR